MKHLNIHPLHEISNLIPKLFFQLRQIGDLVNSDLNISTSERGVMLDLFKAGGMTSPQIAKIRRISRQAIQPVLNRLKEKGLVDSKPNPRKKRSPIYLLSESGQAHLNAIIVKESQIIEGLAGTFSENELETTLRVLNGSSRLIDDLIDKAKC